MNDQELIERLTKVEQSVKSAHHRLDEIESLTKSIYTLVGEVKAMRQDIDELKDDVNDFKLAPAKRYDLIVNTIITVILSGIVGYAIAKVIGA